MGQDDKQTQVSTGIWVGKVTRDMAGQGQTTETPEGGDSGR